MKSLLTTVTTLVLKLLRNENSCPSKLGNGVELPVRFLMESRLTNVRTLMLKLLKNKITQMHVMLKQFENRLARTNNH